MIVVVGLLAIVAVVLTLNAALSAVEGAAGHLTLMRAQGAILAWFAVLVAFQIMRAVRL